MDPESAARLLQELFSKAHAGDSTPVVPGAEGAFPPIGQDQWIRILTLPHSKSAFVFVDRTVPFDELASRTVNPEFPFICFTGTAQAAVPVFISKDSVKPTTDQLVRSVDGNAIIIIGIPLDEPLSVPSNETEPGKPFSSSPFVRLLSILAPERKEIFYILSYAVFVGIIGLSRLSQV